jgi:hypothetical protein
MEVLAEVELAFSRFVRFLLLLIITTCCRAESPVPMHALHAAKLGRLDCNLCHTAATRGSVELQRPGHDQCKLCHAEAFQQPTRATICKQCHTSSRSEGVADLASYPSRARPILIEFSHARHVDPKSRIDATTGFRADCTFCHKLAEHDDRLASPTHTQCAGCHSKPGAKPELTGFLRTAGCRGCHAPEETGDAASAPYYPPIRFSHAAHFRVKQEAGMQCTICHHAIPKSTSLADLPLPRMADCAACHDISKKLAADLRMSNCKACHLDAVTAGVVQTNFNRNIKPAFHTDAFRTHHEEVAAAPDAKCFACHQNVVPSSAAKWQCASCHLVMKPISHSARWKDDVHGKYAALDRTACATCHAADYCSRCHNELPRTHVPLPLFKGGAHANLARLNERSCFTCHTFQNTCSQCHAKGLRPGANRR